MMSILRNLLVVSGITGCLLVTSCSNQMEKDVKEICLYQCLYNKYTTEYQKNIPGYSDINSVESFNNINEKQKRWSVKMEKWKLKIERLTDKMEKRYKDGVSDGDKKKFRELMLKWVDKCDELTKDYKEEDIEEEQEEKNFPEKQQKIEEENSQKKEQGKEKQELVSKRKNELSNTMLGGWTFVISYTETPCQIILKAIDYNSSDRETGYVEGEFIMDNETRKFKTRYSTKDNPNEIRIVISQFSGGYKRDIIDETSFVFKIPINSTKGNGEWLKTFSDMEKFELLKQK